MGGYKGVCGIMRKYNILVTGVGAVVGYGIVNSLKQSKYDCNIVGMDIYEDAVGQFFCDEFIQAVPAANENYITFLLDVFEKYKIDLMFFGTEQEITKVIENADKLGNIYHRIVLNKKDIIEISDDKWKLYEELYDKCEYIIPSYIEGSYEELKEKLKVPFLLKPRRSYASKGIVRIENRNDFEYWKNKSGKQFMVQPIVGDSEHEFTVAAFGFGDGTYGDIISLKRKLSGEGATAKAYVITDEKINQAVDKLCKLLKPTGPTNFQFRAEEEKLYLLEVNPRISSSTSIRTAMGYNEAEMCIEFYLENKKPETKIIKKGSCIRYIADYIIL